MLQTGDIVKINPSEKIAEYLHNLTGKVIKNKKERKYKRTVASNWNPVKIATVKVYCVELFNHSNPELDKTNKKFWFEEKYLTLERQSHEFRDLSPEPIDHAMGSVEELEPILPHGEEKEYTVRFKYFYDSSPKRIYEKEESVIGTKISDAYYKIRQKYPNVKIQMKDKGSENTY